MEESKQNFHVLMVSFSAQGHINPLLTLAKTLQSKANNLHVTLATNETLRNRLLAHHHPTATTTDTNKGLSIFDIDIEFFSDGFESDFDRKGNLDKYMDTLAEVGPTNLYNLIISLSSNQTTPKKLSCIICGSFVPWVADVAIKVGVPCAMLWIQPCSLFAIYYSFYNNLSDFPTEEKPEKSVAIQGLPLLQHSDLPSFVLPSNNQGSVAKTICDALKKVHKFKWVLANSYYELEKDVIESLSNHVTIKTVGPLVPPTLLRDEGNDDNALDEHDQVGISMWTPDDKCISWLNQQKVNSVIYVSFGSLIMLTREQMMVIGTALVKCKRPFLWVIKKQENNPVHEGAGEPPEELLDEIKENGLIVPWCSQDKVLLHKSVACFLTHCGWNSTLETMCAGLPVIGYPFWSDQPTNAKLLDEVFGVGLRLWPDENKVVEIEAIVNCIDEIMDGPRVVEIRAKALEWKRLARETVSGGGSSDRNIQDFVDDIVGNL